MQISNKTLSWNIYLLIARLWLGYSMIMGGQSILNFFSSQAERDFFQNWFGNELGFPLPLFMAFLAKGTEFAGGILLCLGLFTRVAASLVAFVMLIATLVANINYTGNGELIRQDGIVTIAGFLFACIFIFWGAGKFSADRFIFKKKVPV